MSEKKAKKTIEGVYTALITPFTESAEVDYDGFKEIVDDQVSKGVSGLVLLGTTGEGPTLTVEERRALISLAVKHYKGKVTLVVGTGTNSTQSTLEQTRLAKDFGADMAMIVTPYYNKPTEEGLYQHYMSVADSVDIPIMLYNVKGRTSLNMNEKIVARIAQHPNVVALKEAGGDLVQMMEMIEKVGSKLSVLCGEDILNFPSLCLGAKGLVSVASHLVPQELSNMVKYVSQGRLEEARCIHSACKELFQTLFIETNPLPVKTAMACKGFIAEKFRLPLCPMSDKGREQLLNVLKKGGFLS